MTSNFISNIILIFKQGKAISLFTWIAKMKMSLNNLCGQTKSKITAHITVSKLSHMKIVESLNILEYKGESVRNFPDS